MGIRFSMGLFTLAAIAVCAPLCGQEAEAEPWGDEAAEVLETADGCPTAQWSPCIHPGWWGRAEYLTWWTPGMDVPALATLGSATDALPAAIGQPGTQVLFGNTALNDGSRSGGRFTVGRWLDPCHCRGIEVNYLTLGEEDTIFSGSSADVAVFGRPFFNVATADQDARLIADPGLVSGTLNILADTEFNSAEVLYRRAGWRPSGVEVNLLFGYRFAELDDLLRIAESTLSLGGPTSGTSFDLVDQFDTRNTFHGGEVGLALLFRESACWSWEVTAKLAFGESDHRATVSGQTVTTDSMGSASTAAGGLLAQGTNLGTFRWDNSATVSELGITLRRDLRRGWSVAVGCTFLYWSDVARAGDQIDTAVNPTQIPPGTLMGEARPAFPFRTTDFWAQGLRFAVEYNY